jgi:hypothetical protein
MGWATNIFDDSFTTTSGRPDVGPPILRDEELLRSVDVDEHGDDVRRPPAQPQRRPAYVNRINVTTINKQEFSHFFGAEIYLF